MFFCVKGKGKGRWGKREKGKGSDQDLSEFPPDNQSACTHARTETEIELPVGLTSPQPPIKTINYTESLDF